MKAAVMAYEGFDGLSNEKKTQLANPLNNPKFDSRIKSKFSKKMAQIKFNKTRNSGGMINFNT